MKKVLLAIFLAFSLIPISTSFSQLTETAPTLGITLTSNAPFNYKDEDGRTVILGEVENTKSFPVSGVKIWAGFYDEFSQNPLESTIGGTILEVIPPFGKSPYKIISPSANSAITSISVNLLGFNSSPEKQKKLNLELETLQIDEIVRFPGKIINNGGIAVTNTKIHLIAYDAFVPPRVLGISTLEIPTDIGAGESEDFEFESPYDSRTASFKVVAESNNYSTNLVEVTDISSNVPTKLVMINDISVKDVEGNRVSDVTVGSKINVGSNLSIQTSQQDVQTQPFVYWVQIKKSVEIDNQTKSFVEFIGKSEGSFVRGGQNSPSVEWTPENEGLYFIETFVWKPNGLALASKGPLSLINVN